MKIIKFLLLTLLVAGAIFVYTYRSFHPEQPLHHQLNDAGNVLVLASILVFVFLPSGDDDDA